MQSHSLDVLGLELNFRSEAAPQRLEQARVFIEERYTRLQRHGGMVSKEKLLAFLALSLADDIIQMREEQGRTEHKLREFLGKIEKVAG